MNAEVIIRIFNSIVSVATAVGIYFGSLVIFPSFDNKNLSQAAIDPKSLRLLVMAILVVLILVLSGKLNEKKYWRGYLTIGSGFIVSFFIFLFLVYYPYYNKKVIRVDDCNANFFIGDKFRLDTSNILVGGKKPTIEELILGSSCDPSDVWTSSSIEHNYNIFVVHFIITVILYTVGLLLLIQALFLIDTKT